MAISDQNYFAQTKKIAYLSATLNLFLASIKMLFGILGKSSALFADGVHSLSDLLCDGIVLIAAHYSAYPADENHPYGHYRFETFASFALGFMLIAVGLSISYHAGLSIYNHRLDHPASYTLWVSGLSLILYELLYQYSIYIAKKIQSDLLQATAWHNRADAITSLFVFLGLLASNLGYPIFDEIAATLVGLFIFKVGLKYSLKAFRELTDEGLDPSKLSSIKKKIDNIHGVIDSHAIRTRKMGSKTIMDLHVQVAKNISVSEGHHIADQVKHKMKKSFSSINDITVHIDAEADQDNNLSHPSLPSRESLIAKLKPIWSTFITLEAIHTITIHYHNQQIILDILLNNIKELNIYHNKATLCQKFSNSRQSIPQITAINIYLKLD